jgi:hypothetical protein
MKGITLISLLVIHVFLCFSQNTAKTSIQESIFKSDIVVEAEVFGKQSFWDLQHKNIYTTFELRIATSIKGNTEKNLKLLLMGGQVDDILQIVSTSPEIEIGDKGIFMLQKLSEQNKINHDTVDCYLLYNSKYSYIFLGDESRRFEGIEGNQQNNEIIDEIEIFSGKKLKYKISAAVLKSFNSTHKITEFSPKTVTAGTGTTLSIYGEGFGSEQDESLVWFTFADNPYQIFSNPDFEILTWSDSVIQMIVPPDIATGKINVDMDGAKAESTETLIVTYNVTQQNYDPIYMINTNKKGGYTFHLHSNINPYSGAKEVIEKSIKKWICATSVPWEIGNTLDVAQGMDDICSIQFGDLSDSGGETLGRASYFLKSMPFSEPNRYVLSEVDIVFSSTENWCFDNSKIKQQQIDFASVVLHELGHAHMINHVNSGNDLMHFSLLNGEIRNIEQNNVLCGKYIIEKSLTYNSRFFETIEINNPTPPVFSVYKDSLFSTKEFNTYQWLLNGTRITNATNRKYVVATSGNYSLEVTDENNCWLLSESVNVIKSNSDSNDTVFSFSCPPNVMVNCVEDVPLPFNNYTDFNTSGGTAVSTPSPIDAQTFAWESDISDKNSCPETIIRTYTIKNNNDEQISCEQLITIDDNVKPVLIFSNKILSCSDERPLIYKTKTQFESENGNIASDNCGLDWTTFKFLREGEDKENCPQTIVRWYEIYDLCGNRVEARENIIFNDLNPPIIICPADASFDAGIEDLQGLTGLLYSEIEKQIPLNNFEQLGIVAYDSCMLAKITYRDVKTNFCPTKISRTFFAYDACGNFSSCLQQIELTQEIILSETHENDGANNLNTGKIDLTVFGGIAPYLFEWNTGETTEDIDSLDTGDYTVLVTDFNGCSAIKTIKISSEVGKINFDCSLQLTVSCKNEIEESVFVDYAEFIVAGGSAFSDCGIDTNTFIWAGDEILTGSDCININRTFNIKDSCGTTASCVQKITVTDKTPPTLNCTAELVIVGNSKPDYYIDYSTFVSNGGFAVDNCEIVESSFKWISDLSDGKTNPETITRTYQILDFCGNLATCEQKIKIYNNSGIYINCPPTVTITCPESKPNASLTFTEFIAEGGSADSFIDFPLVNSSFQWEGDVQENDSCREIIFRTYSILNENGDYTSCVQQIIVNNETTPKLTCPPNIEIKGNENLIDAYNSLNSFVIAGGSFSDNCGRNSYIFGLSSEFYDTILIPNTLERTYFISDKCGNQELCIQKISIDNTTLSTDYKSGKELKIKIFPNPSNGKFIFEAKGIKQKEVSMSIFNSIGARIVQDKFIPVNGQLKKEMDLSDAAKGIYYIKILDGKSSETQSIIVE